MSDSTCRVFVAGVVRLCLFASLCALTGVKIGSLSVSELVTVGDDYGTWTGANICLKPLLNFLGLLFRRRRDVGLSFVNLIGWHHLSLSRCTTLSCFCGVLTAYRHTINVVLCDVQRASALIMPA